MSPRTMLASWFAPLLIHNHNQQTAMQRAAAASAQGLDPAVYGVPLPGSNVTSTTNNTGAGLLKGALLGAALLAGGTAAGVALKPSSPATPITQPTIPAMPPATDPPTSVSGSDQHYDAVYQEQQPDGTWKEVKREHLK